MVALDTQLPNACVGHSATQCLLWSSSFPIKVTICPSAIPKARCIHVLGYASHRLVNCWSTSNNVAIFGSSTGGGADPSTSVQVVLKGDANPSYREGGLIREGNTSANAIADSNNEAIPRTSVPHSRSRPNRWPFSFSCSFPRTGWDAKR